MSVSLDYLPTSIGSDKKPLITVDFQKNLSAGAIRFWFLWKLMSLYSNFARAQKNSINGKRETETCDEKRSFLNFPFSVFHFPFPFYSGTNGWRLSAICADKSIAACTASASFFPAEVITRTIAPSDRRFKILSKTV